MAQVCKCGRTIPTKVTIGGVERELRGRRHCLDCLPFRGLNNRNRREVLSRPGANRTARFRRWQEKARRERKAELVRHLGGRCSRCGYDRCIAALEFHHRDPRMKQFSVSAENMLRRWETVLAEAEKCELLCANCHRELEDSLYAEALASLADSE